MSKKVKSYFVVYLEYIPFRILYQLIRALPLQAAYTVSRGVFILLYYLDARHRNRCKNHLLHAGVAADCAQATELARKSYASFSMLLAEICKFDQLYTPGCIRPVGEPETLRQILNPNHPQPVIIVTAHYGNWEVAGTGWADLTGIPMVSIMRRFNNPLIGGLILRNRRGPNHLLADKEGGLREALRALREGKHIAILADQHASRREAGVETTFFGHPARTHTSPALLHLKTGVPIAPEITRRVGPFQFEFVFGNLIRFEPTGDKERDVRTLTQLYTSELERLIADRPEQWLWAHRRWLDIDRAPAPVITSTESA